MIDPVEFGRLQAQVDGLEKMVSELRGDMKELLAAVDNAKGGWRTLLVLSSISAAIGGLLIKLIPIFQAAPLK